jgi:hypothetical protein
MRVGQQIETEFQSLRGPNGPELGGQTYCSLLEDQKRCERKIVQCYLQGNPPVFMTDCTVPHCATRSRSARLTEEFWPDDAATAGQCSTCKDVLGSTDLLKQLELEEPSMLDVERVFRRR